MNNKVGIIVDHPDRDGLGLLLVGMELAQRGFDVYLIPFNISTIELPMINPGFVLLNYLRVNNEHFASYLISEGVKVGIIDTEGGAIADLEIFKNAHAKDMDLVSKISLFCSWNARFRDYLKDNQLIPDAIVKVTGQPRLDLYHAFFRDYFQTNNHPASQYSDYVLVNTTFSFTNPRFSTPEKEKEQQVTFFGGKKEIVDAMFLRELEYQEVFFKWLELVIQENPKQLFIYRPHPFESLKNFEKFMSKYENVKLGLDSTVDGWIINSIGLIHSGCSTALEASFVNLPSIVPILPHVPLCSPEIIACSHQVSDVESYKMLVKTITGVNPAESAMELAELTLSTNDGRGYLRVSDEIQRILLVKDVRPNLNLSRYEPLFYIGKEDSIFKKIIKKAIVSFRLGKFFKFANIAYLKEKKISKWQRGSKFFDLKKFQGPFEFFTKQSPLFKEKKIKMSKFENSLRISGDI